MTYESRETSEYSGAPVELYTVTFAGTTYRWTSADVDVVFGGNTYTATDMERAELQYGGDAERTVVQITLPLDAAFAQAILAPGASLRGQVPINIRVGHRGEAEFWVAFNGVLGQINPASVTTNSLTLSVLPMEGMLRRKVPRMTVAKRCQNMYGDARCKVNVENFKLISTITAIGLTDIRELTIAGLSAADASDGSRFLGGVMKKNGIVVGFIASRGSGDVLHLQDPNPDLAVNDTVTLYYGCDRSIQTCLNRFNNVVNFNGWHLGPPSRNPFGGFGFFSETLSPSSPVTTDDPAPLPPDRTT